MSKTALLTIMGILITIAGCSQKSQQASKSNEVAAQPVTVATDTAPTPTTPVVAMAEVPASKPVESATASEASNGGEFSEQQRDEDWYDVWIGQECVYPAHLNGDVHPLYIRAVTHVVDGVARFALLDTSDGFHIEHPNGAFPGKFNVLGEPYAATFQFVDVSGVPGEMVLKVTGHKGDKDSNRWLGGASNSDVAEQNGDFDLHPDNDTLSFEQYIKKNPNPCAKKNKIWHQNQTKQKLQR